MMNNLGTPLNEDQAAGVKRLLKELQNNKRDFWESLTQPERGFFLEIIQELVDAGHSPKLDALYEFDYIEKPPTIYEAMDYNYEDPLTGNMTNYYFGPDFYVLYDFWKEQMVDVLRPDSQVWELCITGSIGGGKTFFSIMCLIWKLVEISHLRDPHKFYNLSGSAPMAFSLFNVTQGRASLSAFNQFHNIVNISPYFRSRFPVDTRKKFDDAAEDEFKYQLKFPKNIRTILGSKPDSAISANVVAGLLDEMNYMELKTAKISSVEDMQAFKIYTNVRTRIQSRFAKDGRKMPGILCNVSSRQSETSFLEKHIETVRDDPGVKVIEVSMYKVKPKGTYSSKTFNVLIGNQTTNHRILDEGEPFPADARVEPVPIDFEKDFRYSLDRAIRDICGIATYGTQPFLRDREKLIACVNYDRINPFPETVFLGTYDTESLEDYVDKDALCQMYGEGYRPKFHPHASRFIHLDLSLTGDCTGISMGCVAALETLDRTNKDGSISRLTVPKVWYDFILRIKPPQAPRIGQIDYAKIRQFIQTLSQLYGYPIKKVTADTYQSADMLQQLEKMGYETDTISLDRGDENYLQARMAIMEERIDMPPYKPLLDELPELYHDINKRKVDHRQGQSKDVADSWAGVICSIAKEGALNTIMDQAPDDAGVILPPSPPKKENFVTASMVYNDLLTDIR